MSIDSEQASPPIEDALRGRRDLLGKAAIAAAVAAVAGVGSARTASATNGLALLIGTLNTGTLTTVLSGGSSFVVDVGNSKAVTAAGATRKTSLYALQNATNGSGTGFVAVMGHTTNNDCIAVYGRSEGSGGAAVYGDHQGGATTGGGFESGVGIIGASNNGAGVLASGTTFDFQANGSGRVILNAVGVANPPAGGNSVGTIAHDAAGNLWYCSTSGNPGSWRTLGGPGAAGAFHAVVPARVYDSRVALPLPGALAAGANKTVSVADKRDLVSGAVTTAGYIPAGATAIACNITVANTVGAGFLTVNPGGNVVVSAATVNWSAPGQILNNGVIVTLDGTRQVTVVAGGSGGAATDFIIDVTGYFL